MRKSLSTLALMVALIGLATVSFPADAEAQHFGRFGFGRGFYGHGFHGHGFGGYYPYGSVGLRSNLGQVRIEVGPKYAREAAQVFVNEGHAGSVDDFDGVFQRLSLAPGEYTIEVRLDGYRPYREAIFLTAGRTYKIRHELERLTAAELEMMQEDSMMEEDSMMDQESMTEKDSTMKKDSMKAGRRPNGS